MGCSSMRRRWPTWSSTIRRRASTTATSPISAWPWRASATSSTSRSPPRGTGRCRSSSWSCRRRWTSSSAVSCCCPGDERIRSACAAGFTATSPTPTTWTPTNASAIAPRTRSQPLRRGAGAPVRRARADHRAARRGAAFLPNGPAREARPHRPARLISAGVAAGPRSASASVSNDAPSAASLRAIRRRRQQAAAAAASTP